MDGGNHRPVEEENHRPTEEENHQSIEEENHRPTEEENRRSTDKDAPGGEGLTSQNVSEVGDDEKDHNDDSADKATDELAKMAVGNHALAHSQVTSQGSPGSRPHTPEYSPITPRDLTPAPRSPPHHRSFTPPDVVSPGSPSEDIFVQGSKSHPPSPSTPYSHQVSHPRHELSPPQPHTRSRSLSPSAQTGTRGASVALSSNQSHSPKLRSGMHDHRRLSSREPSGPSGRHSSSHERSEHGSHNLQPALATSLLALVTSLLTLMTSIPAFVTTLLALGTIPHALMVSPLTLAISLVLAISLILAISLVLTTSPFALTTSPATRNWTGLALPFLELHSLANLPPAHVDFE
ncbi:hypothetical protein BS47DRAFT_1396451 [Hydnum rufescens UP504]|uniref:Uncharacterized protein n=1 Tax=Hydnum rufescens UP504 TaxID=1448309 RepID=A0A9P6DQE1_9AGAM|nr:hypothetical protein BS47DRAFT_1396451 [Hydnum rufescens UP504]